MAIGNRTFLVVTAGGPNGLEIVRHPSMDEFTSLEKAEKMSKENRDRVYYIAEIYLRVVTPREPATEITRLD
jgi:hypothetical protein